MKFKVKIREFLEGLEPAFTVATKGIRRDYNHASLVTIVAEKDKVFVLADGGRMTISNEISNLTCDELNYECSKGGSCTVRASELKATLSSFSLSDEVTVETRAYTEDKASDGDDSDTADGAQSAPVSTGQELMFTLVSDSEQYQTVPCLREVINTPQPVIDFMETKKPDDAFQVRRDIFVYAATKVLFALGFEEKREKYMYWVVRANKEQVRFVSGSGAQFAVLDVDGADISNATKPMNLLIPNEQSAALIDIISRAEYNNEKIYFYTSPGYLIIDCASFRAAISNYEADIDWPDENRFLERSNKLVFTTKIGDWSNVVRGISATYNDEMKKQHDFHYATLDVNFKKNEIATKTDGLMKSNRKVPILGTQLPSADQDNHMLISCISRYLAEAVKHAAEDEFVQIELADSKKPIIVRYHADSTGSVGDPKTFKKTNELYGISERFAIFFSPRKKKTDSQTV